MHSLQKFIKSIIVRMKLFAKSVVQKRRDSEMNLNIRYDLVVDFMTQKAIFLFNYTVYGFNCPANFSDKTRLIGFFHGQLLPLLSEEIFDFFL